MSHEPSEQEVDTFIAEHPDGGTAEQIAEVLGVTRQRTFQIIDKAIAKVQRRLAELRIYRLDDGM